MEKEFQEKSNKLQKIPPKKGKFGYLLVISKIVAEPSCDLSKSAQEKTQN